jgi:integration host factor subunit beta
MEMLPVSWRVTKARRRPHRVGRGAPSPARRSIRDETHPRSPRGSRAMKSDGIHTTTKKELVGRIAEQTGQTKVVVKQVLQAFLDEIVHELAQGNRLEFREFGVFEVKERGARRAQNPRTLEKVDVPAKRIVKFKVGREMRAKVCDEPRAPKRVESKAPPKEPRSEPASAPRQPPRPSSNSPF